MKIVYNNMTVCKIRGYSQTIKKKWLMLYMQRDDPGMNWNLKFFFLPDYDVFVLPNQK